MNSTYLRFKQQLLSLLASGAVTQPTRQALLGRLNESEILPRFFQPYSFTLLETVCDRLVDQDSINRVSTIAIRIDERLAQNIGDGWRYDTMPPDGEMYLLGLTGIDETTALLHQKLFLEVGKDLQLDILHQVQQGRSVGSVWKNLSAARFFEELLAEAVEIYYSDPVIQLEIGYRGMADAYGWKDIGLNGDET
jgi:gluconate 2-dehydrogenase gamma chain